MMNLEGDCKTLSWSLVNEPRKSLDPDLQLYDGPQFLAGSKPNFGINVAKGMAKVYNGERHTFLSQRFDRTETGERIHFASAMTLLGQTDGAMGVSYLDLAEFILRNSASPTANLEELWRRVVFYIA